MRRKSQLKQHKTNSLVLRSNLNQNKTSLEEHGTSCYRIHGISCEIKSNSHYQNQNPQTKKETFFSFPRKLPFSMEKKNLAFFAAVKKIPFLFLLNKPNFFLLNFLSSQKHSLVRSAKPKYLIKWLQNFHQKNK